MMLVYLLIRNQMTSVFFDFYSFLLAYSVLTTLVQIILFLVYNSRGPRYH